MARTRTKTSKTQKPPLKFDQRLVLLQWMFSLFEVNTFDDLAKDLKDSDLEGFTEDNQTRYFQMLQLRLWEREELNNDLLRRYDENIVRNCKEKSNQDLDEFFQKQGYNTKDQEYDIIYVNGDNNLENLRREDQTWKVWLIEEEFKRLMFDVKDV